MMASNVDQNHEDLVHFQNIERTLNESFYCMFNRDEFTDATLLCDNQEIPVHRILLSKLSGYFRKIFKGTDAGIVLPITNIKYDDLANALVYIYDGNISLDRSKAQALVATLKELQIDIDDEIIEKMSNASTSYKSVSIIGESSNLILFSFLPQRVSYK